MNNSSPLKTDDQPFERALKSETDIFDKLKLDPGASQYN